MSSRCPQPYTSVVPAVRSLTLMAVLTRVEMIAAFLICRSGPVREQRVSSPIHKRILSFWLTEDKSELVWVINNTCHEDRLHASLCWDGVGGPLTWIPTKLQLIHKGNWNYLLSFILACWQMLKTPSKSFYKNFYIRKSILVFMLLFFSISFQN